ncbi:hypothetical protein ACFQI3_15425 [Hansschlegelia quercus]|uniref:Uncharacterized protein n=1 Tax=Hansschlegelia quercus TaxID=2528245 RepID=A0A4Q9GH09_9HYPH|nr:hypothetical protein [Hansschlegelia quercus]TBN48269.1 hypothetical protein EYR15_14435 [Hansschlegelia quercus]
MAVVPFKRPEDSRRPKAASVAQRSFGEFAAAMLVIGVVCFLMPMLWAGVPQMMLAVVHLLVAVVYFTQGPRIAAGAWIALTLVCLALTGAPSPVTYAISRAAIALDAGLR